ncbi:MAG: endonuclease/exonuclease/phosphatase family protein [Actinobacteria bacterium]|nr:endonuclease/exonuclease/phosphatase family protein [Actinomycetota bacterium]
MNCRNTANKWRKRAPLLVEQLVDLAPDVIGLQELRHFPSQGRKIAEAVGNATGRAHWLHPTYKTGIWWWWEGIAILSRLPILQRDALELPGQNKVASFARVQLPAGGVLDVYNTHLAALGAAVRLEQMRAVLAWMSERQGPSGAAGIPQVLVGDFNAGPSAESIQLASRVLRSACAVSGGDPVRTSPTPLRRVQRSKRAAVLDYVFVSPGLEVVDAHVTFDRSHPDDPCLFASDHFGVVADISVLTSTMTLD